jgi:hypothetical protein
MDTYLLLRSNKQSGPYSLQQLVSVGLKPYDLVWVEGKSAAWRYPSECEGLKEYAPATEEQPYDRFYKKPEEKQEQKPVEKIVSQLIQHPEEKKETTPLEQTVSQLIPQPEETYSMPVENKTVTTGKKVFVSMPENHVVKRAVQPAVVKAPVIVEEKPKIVEERKVESKPILIREEPVLPKPEPVVPKREPVSPKQVPVFKEQTVSVKEEPTLNEKYSESLDDIKKRYTETYLNRKKKSKWTSTHTSLVQVFGGAIFFCLLVVFAYKNFSGEETSPRTAVVKPDKRAINTSTISNTQATILPAATETKEPQTKKRAQTQKEILDPPDESLARNTRLQSNEEPVKESEFAPVDNKTAEKKAVMTKSTEEQKPEEVKPKTRPVNIHRLVSVKANNYKQRAFGGVLNLELTVDNDSKFELDKVIVELQYLKPSEQPLKTEKIVFSSIGPNDSKTIKVPDYLRGVKVSYRVLDIESSQYERQTAGL